MEEERHEPGTKRYTNLARPNLGEILREEFLKPMGLSAYEIAKRPLVPAPRINRIVLENGVSQRIPQYASPDSSERPNRSG